MAWKTENGNIVVNENGHPIFVKDSGEEKAVDYIAMSNALSSANSESATRKNKIRDLESKLNIFEGIEDLAQYKADAEKAIQFQANADKSKVDAENAILERIKASNEPKDKLNRELTEKLLIAEQQRDKYLKDSAFANSRYVSEKMTSVALAKDLLGGNFKVKEGKVVGVDTEGNIIYSENGIAEFDDAIAKLAELSPHKGVLLKGSNANGSGANSTVGYGSGKGQRNPFNKEHRNVTEQNKIMIDNPTLAKQLMQQAGMA